MLDIIIIIALILSFYVGYRRGFIVQLISLIGLYIAVLLAPSIAKPIGSIFLGGEQLAFVGGFFVVLVAALLIMWFVAPLVGKFFFWNPFKRLDALLGGVLNLAVGLVVVSALFAAFDYANISNEPKFEKFNEYVANNASAKDIRSDVMAVADGDIKTMREFFKPRYVEYETLEASMLFNPLANFGRFITPSMDDINEVMRKEAKDAINKKIFFN